MAAFFAGFFAAFFLAAIFRVLSFGQVSTYFFLAAFLAAFFFAGFFVVFFLAAMFCPPFWAEVVMTMPRVEFLVNQKEHNLCSIMSHCVRIEIIHRNDLDFCQVFG